MAQPLSPSKTAKRYLRNVARTVVNAVPLNRLLFEKLNRHAGIVPFNKVERLDFSDTRHCEHFARHSSHYSSRNYI